MHTNIRNEAHLRNLTQHKKILWQSFNLGNFGTEPFCGTQKIAIYVKGIKSYLFSSQKWPKKAEIELYKWFFFTLGPTNKNPS